MHTLGCAFFHYWRIAGEMRPHSWLIAALSPAHGLGLR